MTYYQQLCQLCKLASADKHQLEVSTHTNRVGTRVKLMLNGQQVMCFESSGLNHDVEALSADMLKAWVRGGAQAFLDKTAALPSRV